MAGQPLASLRVTRTWQEREATSLAWSPDGATFASAVRTEITVSGERETRILAPGQVLDLRFDGAGDRLLAAPYRFEASTGELIDDATAALSADLPPRAARGFDLGAAAFAPDGRTVLLAGTYRPPRGVPPRPGWSGPGTRVVLVRDGTPSPAWEGVAGDITVTCGHDWLAFADTGVRIAPLPAAGAAPEPVELGRGSYATRALSFGPGGTLLAAGFADGSVMVWSTEDRAEIAQWRAHGSDVWALAWQDDRLLTGGGDGAVALFTAAGEPVARTDPRQYRPIRALAVHPDGHTALAAAGGSGAELFEVDLGGG